MRSLLVLLVLGTWALADGQSYSFSRQVGSGLGSSFSLSSADNNITAIRVYEAHNAYITGIQLRFGLKWTRLIGRTVGLVVELELFDNEHIHQVSGKYNPHNFIYSLVFHTSTGRTLMSGQPFQNSFNMYPAEEDQQLIMLSGRFTKWGITAFASHWGPPGSSTGTR